MNLSPEDCELATGGKLHGTVSNECFRNISTDSRHIESGDVFLAIDGDKFDAHNFLDTAINSGASGLIVNESKLEKVKVALSKSEFKPWILAVKDTIIAYGKIAQAWRQRINLKVVAITGSNGKTSVKEMTAHLCGEKLKVFATAGNENNHIGLPRNLLRMGMYHEVAILELGMNHRGELTYLTELCQPDICVITNVGEAHVGNFKHPNELVDAKAELFHATRSDGTAILNTVCPNAQTIRHREGIPENLKTFGTDDDADVRASNIVISPHAGVAFDVTHKGKTVRLRGNLFGLYQVANILAATSIALQLGVSLEEIEARLRTFEAPKMRSQVRRFGSITVIEDCYNSSPTATKQVIHSLDLCFPKKRRIFVLGDMYELGRWEEDYHRQIGRECILSKADVVIGVGPRATWICDEVSRHSSIKTFNVDDAEEAKPILQNEIFSGDVILVKGSRACELERLMDWFDSMPWYIRSQFTDSSGTSAYASDTN